MQRSLLHTTTQSFVTLEALVMAFDVAPVLMTDLFTVPDQIGPRRESNPGRPRDSLLLVIALLTTPNNFIVILI